MDIMTVILRTAEEPRLDRESLERVRRANSAYAEYVIRRDALEDPEDDEGPDNDDAWLFEDLHVLMRIATRLRDKEQMIELIFEVRYSSGCDFGAGSLTGVFCLGEHIGAAQRDHYDLL
jgi:hypothetical protein